MPELPEVHTTVTGLQRVVTGKTIEDVWSDFHISSTHRGKNSIKNKKYFDKFRKIVKNSKIKSVERQGKNILINLSNGFTFIVHMKMTGHLMYGKYEKLQAKSLKLKAKSVWVAVEKGPLQDSYNKFIHLVFSLSDGKHLVLSDMRKFASVTISRTEEIHKHDTVGTLGPDPLRKGFSAKKLHEQLMKRKNWPIKSALLDQSVLAGIGNIYSDEILWEISVHPLSITGKIPEKKFSEMFRVMQKILKFSIKHGGDSKSDYRNAFGEKGGFQNFHKAYGKRKEKCPKSECKKNKQSIIERIVVKGRSSHFCPIHQKIY